MTTGRRDPALATAPGGAFYFAEPDLSILLRNERPRPSSDIKLRYNRRSGHPGTWFPWVNDCHNLAGDCLTKNGLQNPGAPGDRSEMQVCWLTRATRRRQGGRRWINLLFIIVLSVILFWGLHDEPLLALWPYVVLLIVFLFQCVWPTVLGWLFSIVSWLGIAFGYFLFERVVYGVKGFTPGFLFIWGILPAVLLCFFKPRSPEDSTEVK